MLLGMHLTERQWWGVLFNLIMAASGLRVGWNAATQRLQYELEDDDDECAAPHASCEEG